MDGDQQSYFRGSLSQSVIEFFHDYGVDCASLTEHMPLLSAETSGLPIGCADKSAGDDSAGCEMGSVVGFKGHNLRGGLAFVAPASLVAKMLPVPEDKERVELQLRDWSGEIANQLVGRLKNKLASRAFDFDVGTAVCFRGMAIRLSFLPNVEALSLSFSIPSAGVRVYLDCSFVKGASEEEDHTIRIVPEGDVVIF